MEHVQDIPLFLLCCPGRTYFEKFFWVLNFDASLDILDNIIVDHAVLFSLQKKFSEVWRKVALIMGYMNTVSDYFILQCFYCK